MKNGLPAALSPRRTGREKALQNQPLVPLPSFLRVYLYIDLPTTLYLANHNGASGAESHRIADLPVSSAVCGVMISRRPLCAATFMICSSFCAGSVKAKALLRVSRRYRSYNRQIPFIQDFFHVSAHQRFVVLC